MTIGGPEEHPASVGAAPTMRMTLRLLVHAIVGGMLWSAATTGLALTDPGFQSPWVAAYAMAGCAVGVMAGIAGSLVARLLGLTPTYDLPIGGAVATGLPLSVLGAAFGYGYPIEQGAGAASRVVQTVFAMAHGLGCGAATGAVMGCVAMVAARGVFRLIDAWGAARRQVHAL